MISTPTACRRAATALFVAACSALAILPSGMGAQTPVAFEPGMVVTGSVRIAPGVYDATPPAALDEALITVRGSDLTVDLTGVELRGLSPEVDPDRAQGVAIRIDGGENVRVVGGRIRGVRFGILATGVRNLEIDGGDLSHTWKPRLYSQTGHESLLDWLSFHDNEDGQWMRFGAALYLDGVTGGAIRDVVARQGMNGILLTRTDSVVITGTDVSANSGLGMGLYRSSHNLIVGNRMEYDVRGYVHGFYQRGQDSAGLLLYEQSLHNVVAFNSATHSGDGLFLWAGNSTMETGEGGANDNLFFANDFSFAPTNAVEVTFSRNRIVGNWLQGSRYGVWGGYSFETEIAGNCFGGNRYGVAIEHGQDNDIVGNRFDGDSLAIQLWARESQPPDWGYSQHRDVRSRDHLVDGNTFAGVTERYRLERTGPHRFGVNPVEEGPGWRGRGFAPADACDPRALLGPRWDTLAAQMMMRLPVETRGSLWGEAAAQPGAPSPESPALGATDPTAFTWLPGPDAVPWSDRARLDRSAILVDEWGPFDHRSPQLFALDTTWTRVPLLVAGPRGRWRVAETRGVADLSAQGGATGDTLVIVPETDALRDWSVQLVYEGEATVSPRGRATPAGEAVSFGYARFHPLGPWQVRFVTWNDPADDPHLNPDAFSALLRRDPHLARTERRLDYQWYGPWFEELPVERWGLEAMTEVTLPEGGPYTLRTISDDMVRVWVDGTLVIDNWTPHGSELDHATIAPGPHRIRVQHAQLDGWTELRVEVVRGAPDAVRPVRPGEEGG